MARRRQSIFCLLLALLVLIGSVALAEAYQPARGNSSRFGSLLALLKQAYEQPEEGDWESVEAELEAISEGSADDGEVARQIAEHWRRVYLEAYPLRMHTGGERADELEGTALQDSGGHAFVVLGYALKNGKMTPELKGRCDAAAAAARSYPHALLVCSGGATGSNNPENHTEAGLMKDYLVRRCGIDAGRIFTDEKAMNTVDNAVNTFRILREQGVRTITVVTSAYHQKWGQAVYNAMAAVCRVRYGQTVDIIENYCYDIQPAGESFRRDDRIALQQIASMLGLSKKAVKALR